MYIINFLQDNYEFIIGIATIIGIIITAYVKFIRPRYIIPISNFWHRLLNGLEKIDQISTALGPNGGSSLYDKIHSIERILNINDIRLISVTNTWGLIETLTDENGKWIKVNDNILKLTGRPESDFLGNNWINTIEEEHRNRILNLWDSTLAMGNRFQFKCNLLHLDGKKKIPIEFTAQPAYDSENRLVGYVGVGRPIF